MCVVTTLTSVTWQLNVLSQFYTHGITCYIVKTKNGNEKGSLYQWTAERFPEGYSTCKRLNKGWWPRETVNSCQQSSMKFLTVWHFVHNLQHSPQISYLQPMCLTSWETSLLFTGKMITILLYFPSHVVYVWQWGNWNNKMMPFHRSPNRL